MIDSTSNGKIPSSAAASPDRAASNPVLILVAWAVVAVPLAWGVTQTVKTSLALFNAPPQAHSVK
jgi:hypothetical protein